MKNRIRSLKFLTALAVVLTLGSLSSEMHAQQPAPTPPDQQTPTQQTQPQAQPPDQSAQPAPGAQAQPQQTDAQVFSGTVVKQGDRYMLQDESGKSYDIDRQDLAKPHEGKKVRVQGTLDPNGKLILVK